MHPGGNQLFSFFDGMTRHATHYGHTNAAVSTTGRMADPCGLK